MPAPKYKSRFTFGNVVDVKDLADATVTGTVVAVKFTESSVFYDVSFGGNVVKDIPSMRVSREEEVAA